jgi:site-specific DNA recombinase
MVQNNRTRRRVESTGPVPAIAYARVSMLREEMISPEIQLEAIQSWAAANNRVIVGDPLIDSGRTGRNFNRDIQRGIEAVEDGTAREILVWKYSRFGRNRVGFAVNLERVERAGGRLVSVTEPTDPQTSVGRFTRGMLVELAAFESDRYSEQWKEAQAWRLAQGLPHTGDPRFGYRHHKCGSQPVTTSGWRLRNTKDPVCKTTNCSEEYRLDPVTGPVLAEMYARYISGQSLSTITRWLTDINIPTGRGGKWRPHSVADILDSGFGAGWVRVGGRGLPSEDNDVDLFEGSQEAVIDRDDWARYVARRTDMRGNQSETRMRWPLAGITRCGRCGGPMTCTTGGPGGRNGEQKQIRGYIMRCITMQESRTCPGVWRVTHDVEEALFSRLDGLADELESAGRRAARTVREQRVDQSALRRRLTADLDQVRDGRKSLLDAVVARVFTPDEAAEKRQELDAEIASLEAQLAAAGAPPRAWTPPQIRSLRRDWARLPLDVKREMVRLMVESIVVQPDKSIEVMLSSALAG